MFFKTYVLLILLSALKLDGLDLKYERSIHQPITLRRAQLEYLSSLSNVTNFVEILDKILIPRVVGTPTHRMVKEFLKSTMNELGWAVETDAFEDNTPTFGPLVFENVIAKLNPYARRYLVLACHYDSKYFREGEFLGATDSAVPCAMMVNLAMVMNKELKKIAGKNDLSLEFIFFDGEEAFQRWGPRDSLYGSRHLAEALTRKLKFQDSRESASELDQMDLLVLLDLLGASHPTFHNYATNEGRWYDLIESAETRLKSIKMILGKSSRRYFRNDISNAPIEDDHIPFLQKGVPVLHIIPSPFPSVWHTIYDDRDAVDLSVVENLNKILRVFVAEYLGLSDIPEISKATHSAEVKNEL